MAVECKVNCWEYMNCGRESVGFHEEDRGICPAVRDFTHKGSNGGTAAWRICWRVAGTLCNGKIQGSFAEKKMNCSRCEFFLFVKSGEGNAFLE